MIVYEKTFISNVFVTRLWFLLQGYIMDSLFYLETLKIYICRPTNTYADLQSRLERHADL